jgi:hypothetical protein
MHQEGTACRAPTLCIFFAALSPILRALRDLRGDMFLDNTLALAAFFNTCKFAMSNDRFTRTSNSKGKTLDHHRNKSLTVDNFTDIDEIQFGQTNLVDARHVPLGR